jgi:hypothetical protein
VCNGDDGDGSSCAGTTTTTTTATISHLSQFLSVSLSFSTVLSGPILLH